MMTADDVKALLLREVEAAKSIRAWAVQHRISPNHIYDILRDRRGIGVSVLKALKVERVMVYRRVDR